MDIMDIRLKSVWSALYVCGLHVDNIKCEDDSIVIYCKVPVASEVIIDGLEMSGENLAEQTKRGISKLFPNKNIRVKFQTFPMKWEKKHVDFASKISLFNMYT